jgi:hypothetical protein
MTSSNNAATDPEQFDLQSIDKILGRVRKMMALANDAAASEHERDTALKMAYNVLAKYNLSMVDVDDSVPQEQRDKIEAVMAATPWAKFVSHAMADLFFCKYIIGPSISSSKCHHFFIGKQSNATTAMLMSEFIISSIRREARKLYKSDTGSQGRSFALGVVNRLRVRVTELQKAQEAEASTTPGTALVLANLYDSENHENTLWLTNSGIHTKTIGLRTKKTVNGGAFVDGKAFGNNISLAPQVGATKPDTLCLA